MRALLIADQAGSGLAPLTERTCVAMLPVRDKPLVVHAVESLVAAGLREIVVQVGPHTDAIRAELGTGARFGAEIEFSHGEPGAGALGDEFVAMRADVLRSSFVGRFLSACAAHPQRDLRALSGGRGCGLWRRSTSADAPHLEIEMGQGALPITTLEEFHHACLAAVQDRLPGLMVPTRRISEAVARGRGAAVQCALTQGTRVHAGPGSMVRARATLQGTLLVSRHALIEDGARLTDTVVLPDTYVGNSVDLDRAIVWGNLVVHIAMGASERVELASVLDDITDRSYSARTRALCERLTGAVLAVAALPLWLAMLIDSARVDRRRLFRAQRFVGNGRLIDGRGRRVRRSFVVYQAASRVAVLRHLPRLLAVIRGDLALVGARPQAPDPAAEPWFRAAPRPPVGLVGPDLLGDGTELPREPSLRTDLHWLRKGLSSLLSARTWRLTVRV